MLKSWEEMTPLERAHETYSDMYKDAYGFRPRNDVSNWTLADFEKEFEELGRVINADMEREEADEPDANHETADFHPMPAAFGKPLDQKPDADHLAAAEGMGEPKEGHGRHAPGDEIVRRRDIKSNRPACRQEHHQQEDRHHERAGQISGKQVESIEKNPHDASTPPVIPPRNDNNQ